MHWGSPLWKFILHVHMWRAGPKGRGGEDGGDDCLLMCERGAVWGDCGKACVDCLPLLTNRRGVWDDEGSGGPGACR